VRTHQVDGGAAVGACGRLGGHGVPAWVCGEVGTAAHATDGGSVSLLGSYWER